MRQRISEGAKLDVGLVPQSLNGAATGAYHSIKESAQILVHVCAAAMAAAATVIVELLQATAAAGTGVKGIPSTAGQVAKATITANTKVTELTLTLATVLAGDTVTVNGVVFTAHATTTTPANREFDISGVTDTLDATELLAVINNATYGVPGVTASQNAAVLTLSVDEPGSRTITASATGGTVTPATTKANAYVEIGTEQIDKANGYKYVAVKVTTSAAIVVGATLARAGDRYTPEQQVAASKVVGPGS